MSREVNNVDVISEETVPLRSARGGQMFRFETGRDIYIMLSAKKDEFWQSKDVVIYACLNTGAVFVRHDDETVLDYKVRLITQVTISRIEWSMSVGKDEIS